jgi:hypothetical protein
MGKAALHRFGGHSNLADPKTDVITVTVNVPLRRRLL